MQPRAGIANELHLRFDRLTADPAAYRAAVDRECAPFPAGDFFPYTMAINGYVNRALRHHALAPAARQRVEVLAELAIPVAAARAGVAPDELPMIHDYRCEGVYLGQLALALGTCRLIGGGVRWQRLFEHLCCVLHDAFEARGGRPIASFPGVSWGFDSIAPLLALHLDDHLGHTKRHAAVIEKHLAWLDGPGMDPAYGLPFSRSHNVTGDGVGPPRGCDLSWRISLLSQLDRARAIALYRRYTRCFWLERGLVAGFAEWPGGKSDMQDADSGPILWGIGLSATGFGLGAALAAGDRLRTWRLLGLLAARGVLLPPFRPLLEDMSEFDGSYLTGMLMGDVAMFSSATWCDWGTARTA